MQYLAIIRHGEFTEGESRLNAKGRMQMDKLAPLLSELNPVICSSVGPRSIESARLLASRLVKECKAFEFFGSSARSGEEVFYPKAFDFINETTGNIVIVTKGEWADDFIPYFFDKKFGTQLISASMERGGGVLINCENGNLAELP